jgi:TRAP-type C4-dicarboxylate transport system permease small subunit
MGFARLHGRIDAVLSWLETLAAIAAGLVLLSIMALVSIDAVLRHVFAEPLTFQLHLTQFYLLVSATMLALAWGYRKGGAIQVRLLLDYIPARLADPMMRVGLTVSAVYILTLGWRAWHVFVKAYVNDEVVMGVIDWPVAWSWVWVPAGCLLLALRLLLDASAPKLRAIGGHE